MMALRPSIASSEISLYRTACWIAYDSFDGPMLSEEEEKAAATVSDMHGWLKSIQESWSRKLDAALFDLFAGLKAGDLAATGRLEGMVGEKRLEVPSSFWNSKDLEWDWSSARNAHSEYAEITLCRADVLAIWPPAQTGKGPAGVRPTLDLGRSPGATGSSIDPKPSPAQNKPAPDPIIHASIKAAYDTAEKSGTKAPNIVELPNAVSPLLAAKGYFASAAHIRKLGQSPEHAARRRPPGRTVLSETRKR